jgi:excinuclease ABC subunit B
MANFQLNSEYQPTGDQPVAINAIIESIQKNNKHQTLLGVTGSGKTFTMANVIQACKKPTLIISHNKTLAAQLYSEFKTFFPENAVEYFVSYYDYYQPEAYVPQTDTYIEKDSSINDDIERLRISASSSLISKDDVIVIASVSCIYGLGSPEDFKTMMLVLKEGMGLSRERLLEHLVEIHYNRNDIDFKRGTFRVRGDVVDVFPAYLETGVRLEFWGDTLEAIISLDPLTGQSIERLTGFDLYPANQYATPKDKVVSAVKGIREELEERVQWFESHNMLLEAQRIRMRTEYDIELLEEMGFCTGIENYSRYLSGRKSGERPFCLIDFFDKDFLIFIDESHVTIPQIRAMYNGDRARKEKLVEYGFRLPSALDNRPQTFDEFNQISEQIVYVSATPAPYELETASVIAEQVIRPTGLLDPVIVIRPIKGQVEDLIQESQETVKKGDRILVSTLTKRMAEDLADFLDQAGLKVEYLHSDIDAIERVEILRRLRKGDFDVLIGVNLLREGLDLPEVALVAILDADKEGFLRSRTSLIQTAGRAARHIEGRVILYADRITDSIQATLDICDERRTRQIEYNEQHGIVPKTITREIQEGLQSSYQYEQKDPITKEVSEDEAVSKEVIAELEVSMLEAAQKLNFEKAALLRDQIDLLKNKAKGATDKKSNGGFKKRKSKGMYNKDGLPKRKPRKR